MEPLTIVIIVLIAVPLVWFTGTYNGLIRLRNHCRESWSDIDTELTRRHDLIPNLVQTVKGYAAHERQLLESVVALRDRAHAGHRRVRDLCADESQLVRGITQILALAENYPALKADAHFLELQRELVNTGDRIQAARRFYNGNVRDLNNRVEMFPSSLVAGIFKVQRGDFFEVESLTVREVPDLSR